MEIRTCMIMTAGFQLMLNLTRPFIALYGLKLGASTLDVGMIVAAFGVAAMVLAVQMGKIADRFGDKMPIGIGYIAFTAGIVLPFAMHTVAALILSQLIVGVAITVINICVQNVLSHATTDRNRDNLFGWFSVSLSLGGFIGQIIGGFLADIYSYSALFVISAAVSIVQLPLLLFIAPRKMEEQPAFEEQERLLGTGTLQLLGHSGLRKALTASALVLYSRDLFVAFFPLLAAQKQMSSTEIGWIIAIQSLSMVAVRMFLPQLVQAITRNTVLFISIGMAGAAYFLLPVWDYIIFYGFISFVLGIGLGCGQPLSMSMLHQLSPSNRTAEIIGLRLAINRLSLIAAPLIFGTMGSWIGLSSIFFLNGACLMVGSRLTLTSDEDYRQEHPEKR